MTEKLGHVIKGFGHQEGCPDGDPSVCSNCIAAPAFRQDSMLSPETFLSPVGPVCSKYVKCHLINSDTTICPSLLISISLNSALMKLSLRSIGVLALKSTRIM